MSNNHDIRVGVVIVTYGDRAPLLRQVVETVIKLEATEYISKIIIVDNAASDQVKAFLDMLQDKEDRIQIVRLNQNLGSAGGYKIGLETAIQGMCTHIWLLDDDNQPDEKALKHLLDAHKLLINQPQSTNTALISLREDRQQMILAAAGIDPDKIYPRKSSFLGFHFLDIYQKLTKRLNKKEVNRNGVNKEYFPEIPFAPYGGLFFHRKVVKSIGFPKEDFYLYSDDTEYTYRITANGGKIYLIPNSKIVDLTRSWYLNQNLSNSAAVRWLQGDEDFRIYYAIRNQVYIDSQLWQTNGLTFNINKWGYLAILYLLSLSMGKFRRLRLILKAVKDGETGNLGYSYQFSNQP